MNVAGLCNADHFFFTDIRVSHRDILPDCPGLQPGVLQHHPISAAESISCQHSDIRPIDRNRSSTDIVKPHQKIDQGCLAAAGRSNNCNLLPRLRLQRQVLD